MEVPLQSQPEHKEWTSSPRLISWRRIPLFLYDWHPGEHMNTVVLETLRPISLECFSMKRTSTLTCTILAAVPTEVMENGLPQTCHVFFMAIVSAPPHPILNHEHNATQPPPANPSIPPYFTLDNINKTSFQWCRVRRALSSGVIKAFKHRHPLSLHMLALQSVFAGRLVGNMFSPSLASSLFFSYSLFLANAVVAKKSFIFTSTYIWASSAGPTEEDKGGKVVAVLRW